MTNYWSSNSRGTLDATGLEPVIACRALMKSLSPMKRTFTDNDGYDKRYEFVMTREWHQSIETPAPSRLTFTSPTGLLTVSSISLNQRTDRTKARP